MCPCCVGHTGGKDQGEAYLIHSWGEPELDLEPEADTEVDTETDDGNKLVLTVTEHNKPVSEPEVYELQMIVS